MYFGDPNASLAVYHAGPAAAASVDEQGLVDSFFNPDPDPIGEAVLSMLEPPDDAAAAGSSMAGAGAASSFAQQQTPSNSFYRVARSGRPGAAGQGQGAPLQSFQIKVPPRTHSGLRSDPARFDAEHEGQEGPRRLLCEVRERSNAKQEILNHLQRTLPQEIKPHNGPRPVKRLENAHPHLL